jgi:hypothetical protein
MSLVIAIDCDDVLTDTLPKVVHDYNERYGTNVELQHMYREFDEVLAPFGVQNVQEAIQRLHSIYRQKGYYEALQPVAGAVEAAGVKEVILFGDYPWNKRDKLVPGVRRCNNWSDVLTEVERINAAR